MNPLRHANIVDDEFDDRTVLRPAMIPSDESRPQRLPSPVRVPPSAPLPAARRPHLPSAKVYVHGQPSRSARVANENDRYEETRIVRAKERKMSLSTGLSIVFAAVILSALLAFIFVQTSFGGSFASASEKPSVQRAPVTTPVANPGNAPSAPVATATPVAPRPTAPPLAAAPSSTIPVVPVESLPVARSSEPVRMELSPPPASGAKPHAKRTFRPRSAPRVNSSGSAAPKSNAPAEDDDFEAEFRAVHP